MSKLISDKQISLIQWMNKVCDERFDFDKHPFMDEAQAYISRNIDEFNKYKNCLRSRYVSPEAHWKAVLEDCDRVIAKKLGIPYEGNGHRATLLEDDDRMWEYPMDYLGG